MVGVPKSCWCLELTRNVNFPNWKLWAPANANGCKKVWENHVCLKHDSWVWVHAPIQKQWRTEGKVHGHPPHSPADLFSANIWPQEVLSITLESWEQEEFNSVACLAKFWITVKWNVTGSWRPREIKGMDHTWIGVKPQVKLERKWGWQKCVFIFGSMAWIWTQLSDRIVLST